jgi:hypothetical protein
MRSSFVREIALLSRNLFVKKFDKTRRTRQRVTGVEPLAGVTLNDMWPWQRSWRLAVMAVALAGMTGGCRRRAPPSPRPAAPRGGPSCPSAEALAQLVREPGRLAHADCLLYAPGFFWLGAVLTHDVATAANPRLALIYGGQPPGLFDLQPVPQDVLSRIIQSNQDLRVSIRKPSRESRLVRVGVFGQHGGDNPEADELVLVLRLVAHSPPEILWVGAGDQVHTQPSGCVTERTVDFEMPFGERLEMTTAQRAHRRDPAGKQTCLPGPSTQQTVDYRPQPLKPSRPLARL